MFTGSWLSVRFATSKPSFTRTSPAMATEYIVDRSMVHVSGSRFASDGSRNVDVLIAWFDTG